MIQVETLSKQYQNLEVLSRIDWLIEDGAFAVLTGRSGGGKTTLLSIIGGLTKPDAGRVLIDGMDLWSLSEPELATLRNKKFGFVFQFASLIPTLTVLDNILLPVALGGKNPDTGDKQFAQTLLEMVGVAGKALHYPSQLSGGQQRRVSIARALVNRPPILLADEPTGDLDEASEAEIMRLFQELHRQGTSIVMVTHALNYARFGAAYTLKNSRLALYEEAQTPLTPTAPSTAASHG